MNYKSMIQIWYKVTILFQETRYLYNIRNLRISFGSNLSLLSPSKTRILKKFNYVNPSNTLI
jgi:hypothetical protein